MRWLPRDSGKERRRQQRRRRLVSFLNLLGVVTQEGDLSFLSKVTARVCGGIFSPLIEPKMGREWKGLTCGPKRENMIDPRAQARSGARRSPQAV